MQLWHFHRQFQKIFRNKSSSCPSQKEDYVQWNNVVFGCTTQSFRSDSKLISNIFKRYVCLVPTFLLFFFYFFFFFRIGFLGINGCLIYIKLHEWSLNALLYFAAWRESHVCALIKKTEFQNYLILIIEINAPNLYSYSL